MVIGHFPQKSPKISGSFAGNDLQVNASYGSLPPCMCPDLLCLRICDYETLVRVPYHLGAIRISVYNIYVLFI